MSNDNQQLSLSDAEVLAAEIARLRARVAELEAATSELDRLAHLDPLVNLPNRRRFVISLEQSIARALRGSKPDAIILADIDGLKQINDTFGHEAGDAALVEVAKALVAATRHSDLVARLSGDEFAILLEGLDNLSAWQMALRIVETVMGVHFCFKGRYPKLSVAVGVAVVDPGDTVGTVMCRADQSMYRLKAIRPHHA